MQPFYHPREKAVRVPSDDDLDFFGVDYNTNEVVMLNGQRYAISNWIGMQGSDVDNPLDGVICIFQGGKDLWYTLDVRELLKTNKGEYH